MTSNPKASKVPKSLTRKGCLAGGQSLSPLAPFANRQLCLDSGDRLGRGCQCA